MIDAIQTTQMKEARSKNQTPFALLKPAKGTPVLVKVLPMVGGKNLLVPANAEDLKQGGQLDEVQHDAAAAAAADKARAVQIKVR